MYFHFIINIIEVLFFCGLIILVDLSLRKKYSHFVRGLAFGLITIFIMSGNVMIGTGHLFDFRNITMTMAGFIGGPLTAALATVISSVYRYSLGGTGAMGGIAAIIVFGGLGTLLGKLLRHRQNGKKVLPWFLIGLVLAVIPLAITGLSHRRESDLLMLLRSVSAPLLIITPLATTLIFNFYFWVYGFFAKAFTLNAILDSSAVNLMVFDDNGLTLMSENLKRQSQLAEHCERTFRSQVKDAERLDVKRQQSREMATADGKYFVVEWSGFRMPGGGPALAALLTDVTDRRREQEALKKAKDRFLKAFELDPHMMAILGKPDYRYVDVNRRFLEARGLTREEVIGKRPTEIGVPECDFTHLINMLETEGVVQNLEGLMVMKDGHRGIVLRSAQSIEIDERECVLIAYNDVTAMKQMQEEREEQLKQRIKLERELAQSNQRVADILTNMPDAFFVLDNQWAFSFVNKKAGALLQRAGKELLSGNYWEVIPQARGTSFESNLRRVKQEHLAVTFENPSLFHKGIWFRVDAYPFQSGVAVHYTDITERKLMRESLIRSQKEMTSILESMTDCFFAINDHWQFTYVNAAAETAFGKSRQELLGREMTEVFKVNDAALESCRQVMSEKRSLTVEIVSKALGDKWLELSVYPAEYGLTCYFRDITDRKVAEKEIARLDRLDLVGQMAAGIGHEIRNPMTTVRGYLQLLGTKPQYEAQKRTFDLMISELDRANSIISEFLFLARERQTELQLQSLNDILNHLYPLLEADTFTQAKRIECILGEIPYLRLNEKKISQLVLNLVRNGLEAMSEGGCLTIKTYVKEDKVVLTIEDQGCGIPLEDLDKLGTPFFTTKDNGTGLGLATSFKIAASHQAKVQIESSPQGTKFHIYFPFVEVVHGQSRDVV